MRKPIDQPYKKAIQPNIPEEKLFNLNAQVIEFKKPKFSEESEFDIDESEEQFTHGNRRKHKQTSHPQSFYYSDIGYSESTGRDRKFVNVPVSTTASPIITPIDPDCMGKIIDVPCENCYLEEMLAEYGRNCEPPKDIFTR